jgi:hypothetical protein
MARRLQPKIGSAPKAFISMHKLQYDRQIEQRLD